jgi:hypothetical protein
MTAIALSRHVIKLRWTRTRTARKAEAERREIKIDKFKVLKFMSMHRSINERERYLYIFIGFNVLDDK